MLKDSRKLVHGINRLKVNFSPKRKPSMFLIGTREGMAITLINTTAREVRISQKIVKAMKSRQRQRVLWSPFLKTYLPTKNRRFLISR